MRSTSSVLVTAGLLIAWSTPARPQSLAEVARQEAERRKTVPRGKVFTNGDLKPVPAPEPPAPAQAADQTNTPATPDAAAKPADATTTKPAASVEKSGKQQDPRTEEAYWHARMTTLRENLERNKTLAAALESRINGLNQDFVNRDDPAQREKIAQDREKALAEQERILKAVADGPIEIAAAEEEARQLGVPPGWLR
jgi:hypothetical protein